MTMIFDGVTGERGIRSYHRLEIAQMLDGNMLYIQVN